jgi:hypothetical protein
MHFVEKYLFFIIQQIKCEVIGYCCMLLHFVLAF